MIDTEGEAMGSVAEEARWLDATAQAALDAVMTADRSKAGRVRS
mgnify:CR=1 FL=1